MTIRPYQSEWLDKVVQKLDEGINRQVGRAATGTGKTVFFANLPDRLKLSQEERLMYLVHREELATQSAEKIAAWNPYRTVGVEMGDQYAGDSDQLVVAGVQSIGRLGNARIKRFKPETFRGLVIDEFHHSASTTYANVMDYFGTMTRPEFLTLGVTATLKRGDGKGFDNFNDIVFDMPLLVGIHGGWLADIRGFRVKTKVVLDAVSTVGGDFNQGELEHAINIASRNDSIVQAWIDLASNRQTVVFAVDIQHSKDLAAAFQRRGIVGVAIWGADPHRAEKLAAHKRKDIQVLVNCQLLTEGYDDWQVSCVVLARPTQSQSLYEQMVGRGTRIPSDISNLHEAREKGLFIAKDDLIVIDVVDLSKRYSLNSVSTLFGLSASLDTKGVPITEVVKALEEAAKKVPEEDLEKLTDFANLDVHVEQVDLFRVQYAPEVQESEYQWHKASDGTYVMMLTDKDYIAVYESDGKWAISGEIKEKRMSCFGTDFNSTIEQAESWVRIMGGKTLASNGKKQPSWYNEPPPKYMLGLAKLLGIRVPEGATRGQVSEAINRVNAERKVI